MHANVVARCPYCSQRIGLPWGSGTRFRCRYDGCRREFDVDDVRPKPEHFGLAQQELADFNRNVEPIYGLFGALGLVAGIIVWLEVKEYLWLFALLGYVSGAVLGSLVDKARNWEHQSRPEAVHITPFPFRCPTTRGSDVQRLSRLRVLARTEGGRLSSRLRSPMGRVFPLR